MKENVYRFSFIPFLTILFFSIAFSMAVHAKLTTLLKSWGMYEGLSHFFTASFFNGSAWFVLFIFVFMALSSFNLIGEMLLKVSLYFFMNDKNGTLLKEVVAVHWFILSLSFIAVFFFASVKAVFGIYVGTYFSAFVYILVKISDHVSTSSLVGIVFFQLLSWLFIIAGFFYIVLSGYGQFLTRLN